MKRVPLKNPIYYYEQCNSCKHPLKTLTVSTIRSGRLDHSEFKACLRSLGFDLPVPVEGEPDRAFEAILDIVDRDRDGFIRLEEYMQVCHVSSRVEISRIFTCKYITYLHVQICT